MRKNRKRLLFLIFSVIIVIILVMNGINSVIDNKIEKEIVIGYAELMDQVIDEYLSGTGTNRWGDPRNNTYATQLELENIDYIITEITTEKGSYASRKDDTYVLNIEINLTCSKTASSDEMLALSEEVFRTFYDVQGIVSGIKIRNYECSYYPTVDPDFAYEDLITIFVNGEKTIYPQKRSRNTGNKSEDSKVKCRRSGCGEEAVYSDWNRRYCTEHIRETHYCRYPGCINEVPNISKEQYCYEHN